jgi:predicted signal transduction protein with EAL and GGDEF domain
MMMVVLVVVVVTGVMVTMINMNMIWKMIMMAINAPCLACGLQVHIKTIKQYEDWNDLVYGHFHRAIDAAVKKMVRAPLAIPDHSLGAVYKDRASISGSTSTPGHPLPCAP